VRAALADRAEMRGAGADGLAAPFGAHALPTPLERLRQLGAGLGPGWAAKWVASAIRRICLLGRPDPVDVAPFPGQSARLYPRDNLSEKRVFGAAVAWDAPERAALGRLMAETAAPLHFVDAGANAGLYTLAMRSLGPIRGLAIEPDPVTLARLRFNLAASGAAEVTVAPVALGAEEGMVSLSHGGGNRGEVAVTGAVAGAATGTIPARPLLGLVTEAGLARIDALKIDIEGAEEPVLRAFFRDAPRALWPRMIVIEAQRGADTPALSLAREAGYVERERTRMNAILAGTE